MSREAVQALERLRQVADDETASAAKVKQALIDFMSQLNGAELSDIDIPERALILAIGEVRAGSTDLLA